MQNASFYSFSIAFLLGVAFCSIFDMGDVGREVFVWILICTTILFLVSAISFLAFRRLSPKKRVTAIVLGTILCFCLGALRMEITKGGDHPLDNSVGQKISLSGFICDEPTVKDSTVSLCFEPMDVKGNSDRILINVSKSGAYEYGECISIEGKLGLPKNFYAYDGGPEFDYVSYLKKDQIRFTMMRPKVTVIQGFSGNIIVSYLIKIKSIFMESIRRSIPEPQASLVGGLLLGEKGTLPKRINDDFKRSGLTHILVLSGSNVTVVAESLLIIFSFLPRSLGRIFGALSVVLFALMTGASATTIRATIMALTRLFTESCARRYDVSRSLTLSAVFMIIDNPLILMFDISFELSFLATIAVVYVAPLVKQRLGFIPEFFGMREVISMTLATQLFTLPFIFFKMGQISVIALLPNLLVLPMVPYAMLGGFITGILGLVHYVVAFPIASITRTILAYMLSVTSFFSAFPFATIQATFGPLVLCVSYIFFGISIWFLRRRMKNSSRQSAN